MTVMTSREFNQHVSQAQKAAQSDPVIITNRGEPAYVLMTYAEYEKNVHHNKPFIVLQMRCARAIPMWQTLIWN